MASIAFIGLGVMGGPVAGHLALAGHQVYVYNRTSQKAADWIHKYPGVLASCPADAASDVDLVFTCVGDDDDLREITMGDGGVLSTMRAGSVLVDHTTVSATVAREVASRCNELGCGFVDAPLSGGQKGAEEGMLAIMCGGMEDHFNRVEPVMTVYAKSIVHMGEVGHGQLTKMVNQICIAGLLQGLAEGLAFASNAKLDIFRVLDAIGDGAAGSWQMRNRGSTMVEDKYDFGFAVNWMRKDLAICLDEARLNGSDLEVTALVDKFYKEIQGMGGGRWDTSSLLRRLTRYMPPF